MILAKSGFWRDAAVRAVRNAVQVTLPVLTLTAAGVIDRAGALAVVAAAGLAGLLSLLKSVAGLQAPVDAAPWVQALERAAAAAAGAVAALLPLDLAHAVTADWGAIAVAAAGAAALSVATWVLRGTGVEGEGELIDATDGRHEA